jgi:hypothetical protein
MLQSQRELDDRNIVVALRIISDGALLFDLTCAGTSRRRRQLESYNLFLENTNSLIVHFMDSAFSAVMGSLVGAFTSFVTTYANQRAQCRRDFLSRQFAQRETLYSEFINEAARLMADSLEQGAVKPFTDSVNGDIRPAVTADCLINQPGHVFDLS